MYFIRIASSISFCIKNIWITTLSFQFAVLRAIYVVINKCNKVRRFTWSSIFAFDKNTKVNSLENYAYFIQRTYSNQNLSAIQYSWKNLIAKLRKDTHEIPFQAWPFNFHKEKPPFRNNSTNRLQVETDGSYTPISPSIVTQCSVVREETRFPRLVRHHRASSSSKTRRAGETPSRIFPHDSHEGETRRTLTRSLRSKETTRRDIIKSCHGYTQDPVSRRGVALGRGLNIRTRTRENNPYTRPSITQERLSITDRPDSEISAV